MKQLLLVGGGHAHLFVLRYLAEQSICNVNVTLVSPSRWVDYSGMLPGWVAGIYSESACQIDLLPLAHKAGVNFVEASVIGLSVSKRIVQLNDNTELCYDLLSLDIGSETDVQALRALDANKVVTVRPFADFRESWKDILQDCQHRAEYTLAVVGGGAAGVELALAANAALAPRVARLTLVLIVGSGILSGHSRGVKALARRQLQDAGVRIIHQRTDSCSGGLLLPDGTTVPVDKIIAATGAKPAAWLKSSGLALDVDGFIQVDATHRSVSTETVFAAGNVCSRVDQYLPKSGVHAVHAGPVLARNLCAVLEKTALQPYRPRKFSLYLLSCANGQAIASWGPLYARGQWLWRLKDYIDRRFIDRFTRL